MPSAWRWTVTNPYGHSISCSEERWQHIVSRRPYMAEYEEIVKATVRFPMLSIWTHCERLTRIVLMLGSLAMLR